MNKKGFRQSKEEQDITQILVNQVNKLSQQAQMQGQLIGQLFNQLRQVGPEVNALSSLAASVKVDRPAKENDFVMVDYLGALVKEDGEPEIDENGLPVYFEGGYGSRFVILGLGGGTLIPGFEEQIVGRSAGETLEIVTQFPENYHAAGLANKKAKFLVHIHGVSEPIGRSVVDQAKLDYDMAITKIRQERAAAQEAANKAAAEAQPQTAEEVKKPMLSVVPSETETQ